MNISKKDSQLIILLSGIVIIIPMVVFPARLGMDISTGSFAYAIVEILWYAAVFFVMRSQASILQVFQGAGLTFLYRIVVGTIFGLFISIMYGVNLSAALSLGVSRYFPAILLHIITAPFIMKTVYLAILGEDVGDGRRPRKYVPRSTEREENQVDQPYFPKKKEEAKASKTGAAGISESARLGAESRPEMVLGQDINGFERAVRYLGELGAVRLAAVVDKEGLSVAIYLHGEIDIEKWTPLAELFKEVNNNVIKRNYESPDLQRIDLYVGSERIFVLEVSGFSVMVISNREEDELLGVRLHQAAEMVRKYISERYGRILSSGPEEKYVSNTRRA